ncbi:MAG: type III-B CRISPR module-associated protein Cmr5 [Candidatus Korarchaeum sp.]
MEDLERGRLLEAIKLVSSVKGSNMEREFLSLARRLPTLLMSSGLLLTAAYLQKRSKEKKEDSSENRILEFMKDWFKRKKLIPQDNEDKRDLLNHLLELEPLKLSILYDEAIWIAEALKIVAEAMLEGES